MAAPLVRSFAWMDRAACSGVPGFTDASVPAQIAICQDCPVIDACRRFGIEQARPTGNREGTRGGVVFGGLAPRELVALAKARRS